MALSIFVLNGPNLNLLGSREPEVYGRQTLSDIESQCAVRAKERGLAIDFRQTNHEGVLVDWVHEARGKAAGVIVNAAALTHTSIALHDALKTLDRPVIEVHLSNLFKRETFRHISYVTPVAHGLICGFGAQGYCLAIDAMAGLVGPA